MSPFQEFFVRDGRVHSWAGFVKLCRITWFVQRKGNSHITKSAEQHFPLQILLQTFCQYYVFKFLKSLWIFSCVEFPYVILWIDCLKKIATFFKQSWKIIRYFINNLRNILWLSSTNHWVKSLIWQRIRKKCAFKKKIAHIQKKSWISMHCWGKNIANFVKRLWK